MLITVHLAEGKRGASDDDDDSNINKERKKGNKYLGADFVGAKHWHIAYMTPCRIKLGYTEYHANRNLKQASATT